VKPTAVVTGVLALATLVSAGETHATVPDPRGELHGDAESAELTVGLGVADDGLLIEPRHAGSRSSRSLVVYEWIAADNPNTLGLEHLCPLPGDPLGGWVHLLVGRVRGSGDVVTSDIVCLPRDPTSDSAPPAPPVPSAPSIEEIWRSVALPPPRVRTDPPARGITGLETRYWIDTAPTATVSVTVDGYTVTGSATVVAMRVDPGDGAAIRVGGPGGPDSPALRHTYETKGRYTLRATTTWRADVRLTGPGIAAATPVDLGVASLTTTRTYQVNEIVVRLTR